MCKLKQKPCIRTKDLRCEQSYKDNLWIGLDRVPSVLDGGLDSPVGRGDLIGVDGDWNLGGRRRLLVAGDGSRVVLVFYFGVGHIFFLYLHTPVGGQDFAREISK